MKKLVMATNNADKLHEVRQMLEGKYEICSLAEIGCHEDIPETADTLEGNALQKMRYVKEHYGIDCFADDTGLEVEALDGAPGVYTARFGMMNGYGKSHDAQTNIRCLLDKLEQMDPDTLAQFGAWLEQEGLQAIATRVSTGSECSIIIEDGYAAQDSASQAPARNNWKAGEF